MFRKFEPLVLLTLRQFTFKDMLEDRDFTTLPITWQGTPDNAKQYAESSGYQWKTHQSFIFGGYWWNPNTHDVMLPV